MLVEKARAAKAWREANPDRYNAARVEWLLNNRPRLSEYVAERSAALKQRTPAWADVALMDALTQCAKEMSKDAGIKYVVDHRIPLRGALVSGLHVPFNLRIVTYEENRKKGSFFRTDL